MGEWPDDWFRDGRSADNGNAANKGGVSANADKTIGVPAPQHPGGQYSVGGQQGQRPASPPGSWPKQPPTRSASGVPGSAGSDGSWSGYGPAGRFGSGSAAGSGGGQAGGGVATQTPFPSRTGGPRLPGMPGWRGWLRPRRVFLVLGLIVALLVAGVFGTYFYLNSKLTRSDILVDYPGRPSPGVGTNWLIAGSDSRQGLTRRQERRYHTGQLDSTGFGRSDTILILHIPAGGGKPLLISIPRDSYVQIPGQGWNKINAAFTFGGPRLLAKTIQDDTGLYINHFMDIGFGGFVRVVDAVGGVRICLVHKLHDRASGLRLSKGCHVFNGQQALAYVRDRHNFLTQDLQREQDQRIFLKALLTKLTSPGVILNPFAALPAASNAVATLTVDKGTSLYQLYGVAKALRNPLTTTVPIANSSYITSAGDAVQWNSSQAKTLFSDLMTGQTVPKSLITGSHQGK